jgi:hypothetical protein
MGALVEGGEIPLGRDSTTSRRRGRNGTAR